MRHFFHLVGLSFAILAVALTGCGKKEPRPAPSDTVMGGTGSSVSGSRGDFVSPDFISPQGLNDFEGLTPRSASAGFANGEYSAEDVYDQVFFGFDEYFIAPAERPKLEAAADYLRANPRKRAICVGHTDWYGTVEYNLGLGDRRATAAKNFLVQLGIPANRIETFSKGKLDATEGVEKFDPIAVRDRRVDVVIID